VIIPLSAASPMPTLSAPATIVTRGSAIENVRLFDLKSRDDIPLLYTHRFAAKSNREPSAVHAPFRG
jgi:hypothetical protein